MILFHHTNDESVVFAGEEATPGGYFVSPLADRQIAAPPSCVSSLRDGLATGANDESNSVAARPFACILLNNMRPLCGKGSWQSALKSFENLRHIGCKKYLR